MAWREEVFRGDPWDVSGTERLFWESRNLFNADRFISTRMVDSIVFTDAGRGAAGLFINQHQHRRWTMQYDFLKKGKYRIGYTTDDGMRIKVSGINNGQPLRTDSWKVQDDTSYVVDFDINTLGPQTITVEHFNHEKEWSARVNGPFLLQEFTDPEVPETSPSPILNSIVFTPSTNAIVKTYLKDSLALIDPETVGVKNTSTTYLLQVTIQGRGGLTFNPSVIQLQPLEEKTTQIKFDSNQVNQYEAGRNQINCLVSVVALGIQEPDIPVEEPADVPIIVTINPISMTLTVGQTQQFNSSVTQGGATVPGATVTWSSSNPAVMTVNSAGQGTALAAGTARVTVSYSGISAMANVIVGTSSTGGGTTGGGGGATGDGGTTDTTFGGGTRTKDGVDLI